ncbi:hypothetical protein BO218_00445 [Microbacterium paludicola]|nr:hypothetical protein BO218_00445 [Microbacterium paludicola]
MVVSVAEFHGYVPGPVTIDRADSHTTKLIIFSAVETLHIAHDGLTADDLIALQVFANTPDLPHSARV